MDPEIAGQIASRFPVFEQVAAAMLALTMLLLSSVVGVGILVVRAVFVLAKNLGGLTSTIQLGFESVITQVDAISGKIDSAISHADAAAQERDQLRRELGRAYPRPNGEKPTKAEQRT